MPQKQLHQIGGVVSISTKSREEAAALLNVGTSTIDRARRVQRDGVPELVAAVEAGNLTVTAALNIAKLGTLSPFCAQLSRPSFDSARTHPV